MYAYVSVNLLGKCSRKWHNVGTLLLDQNSACICVIVFVSSCQIADDTARHNDSHDDNSHEYVSSGRQPERIPIQRRVTVVLVARCRCEL